MLSLKARLAAFAISVAVAPQAASAAAGSAADPADDPAYMWDLGDLYPTPDAWRAEYNRLQKEISGFDHDKGTLGQSAAQMLAVLDRFSNARKTLNRLAVYAMLKADENVKIAANQERAQSAHTLDTLLHAKTAWLSPEVLAIGAEKVHAFGHQSPELKKRFGFFLDDILRAGPHTLGVEAEGVLAEAGTVLGQPDNIFSQLASGELPRPEITLSDGTKVTLDQAAYEKYRQRPNRDDRKKVFDAFWAGFGKFQGTFGATLTTQVLAEVFQARARHFPDSLSAATFADNMPASVYRTLVSQANANLPTLYRYLSLRKKELGITDSLAYYDLYAPIFDLPEAPKYSVAESKRIARDVTAVYGPEYTVLLDKGFSGRWMNLFPHPGKADGAYMNGAAYDVHPYLLFNNHDDYESLSTFVHEWGHAVHSLLANKAQPFETADYSTFIAETASIANELLLNDYMVAHSPGKAEKLYFLGRSLELIRTTFFRQTMFAEFQLAIHDVVEQGDALSGERMTEIYCGLLKKYYGDAQGVTKIDPHYCLEWAYIPHFYYGFYVYQYATSIAGAAQLTDAIAKEGAPARDRFIAMLKAGGSDYPYEIYKKAGIDMATPEPYAALMARMNAIMDRIDALQGEK